MFKSVLIVIGLVVVVKAQQQVAQGLQQLNNQFGNTMGTLNNQFGNGMGTLGNMGSNVGNNWNNMAGTLGNMGTNLGNTLGNLLPNGWPSPTKSGQTNPTMKMAEDPVMFDGYDMQRFLCSSCRFLIAAAKRYYQQNPNNQQTIEFFQTQKYYDDLKDSCQKDFDKSGARSGKYFGCQTVLIQSITDIQQKILDAGSGFPRENNQICFEKGVGVCKSSILSVITGKK